jgi:hypothetical protein
MSSSQEGSRIASDKRRGSERERERRDRALWSAQGNRGCLKSPLRIVGSLKEANGIEDAQIAIEDS